MDLILMLLRLWAYLSVYMSIEEAGHKNEKFIFSKSVKNHGIKITYTSQYYEEVF